MVRRFFRRIKRFFYKSRTINNEPINKISLAVIILIDIFILVNVFIGLDDIGRWYISPGQAYGCQGEWTGYRTSEAEHKADDILRAAIENNQPAYVSLTETYQQWTDDHLGGVDPICTGYAQRQVAVAPRPTAIASRKSTSFKRRWHASPKKTPPFASNTTPPC
jgi:hypothetical protein